MPFPLTAEHKRLADSESRKVDWKNWGPYLSERAWGTVWEDYNASGTAWGYFPHDHARNRTYHWNEDGKCGFCNRFRYSVWLLPCGMVSTRFGKSDYLV